MPEKSSQQTVIVSRNTRLPFSRGILARSLVRCGIDPTEAYSISLEVQSLLAKPKYTREELARLVLKVLRKTQSPEIIRRYRQRDSRAKGIEIKGKQGAMFSKGLLARSLRVTAIDYAAALSISRRIEENLKKEHVYQITVEELRHRVYKALKRKHGRAAADRYETWRDMIASDYPLIVLIGGATGAGKSTLALELASRLKVTQAVSTDIIRGMLRTMFSEKMLPATHKSSYLVGEKLKLPPGSSTNKVVVGYHEQSLLINVNVESIIRRCIDENLDIIINGVHLLPGLIDRSKFPRAVIVKIVLRVSNPELHMQRFLQRQRSARRRKASTYLRNFKNICKIQDYIIECAKQENIPIIDNVDFSECTEEALSYIFEGITSSNLLPRRKRTGRPRRK